MDVGLHTAAQVAAAVERARIDPVWFLEEVCNIKRLPEDPEFRNWSLDPWQAELVESVADVVRFKQGLPTKFNHQGLNKITVRAMHGPGKTFGAGGLMHWFGFCFQCRMPCTAPKLKQLQTRLWPEFRKIKARANPLYQKFIDVKGSRIRWIGADGRFNDDHTAFQETASAPENLAGLHDDYMLFLVDEASGVDEKLWPVIEGAISTGIIVILVTISNPTKVTGSFADSFLKERVAKYWYKLHVSLDKTTRVSRDWVNQMGEKYGTDSPVFKIRCLGEFAESDENQLIAVDWVVAAKYREPPSVKGDGSVRRLRLSVDVADGGEDLSEIVITEHYDSYRYFRRRHSFSFPTGKAALAIAREAARLFDAWGGSKTSGEDSIVVDGLGVGAGTVNWLLDKGYPVINYKGGAASDDKERYRNRRVQSYMVLRDEFSEGLIIIDEDFCESDLDWEDYIGQVTSIKTRPGADKYEDLVTKLDMKRLGLKSPDAADASAMQYATQLPEIKGGLAMPVVFESEDFGDNADAYLT